MSRLILPDKHLTVRTPYRGVETILPSLANNILLTSGAANTYGAWTTIGTPGTDAIMSAFIGAAHTYTSTHNKGELELRYNSATTFDEIDVTSGVSDAVTLDAAGSADISRPLLPFMVPTGLLIEARYRAAIASSTLHCWLEYFTPTDFPRAELAQLEYRYRHGLALTRGTWTPTLAGNGTTITPGAAWAVGNWTQMIASANAGLLVGVRPQMSGQIALGRGFQFDVGIGAAASEIVVARAAFAYGQGLTYIDPPVELKQGDRVALRAGGSAGIAQVAAYVKTHDFQ